MTTEQKQTTQNPAEVLPDKSKLSKLDMSILTLAKANPGASAYQIGKQLLKSGISKNRLSVYHRLKKNDYLQAEFKRLENYNREQLVREDMPLARKVVRKHLKNKDKSTPAAVQIQAAKLIYDKALADRQDKVPESPVIIENIERLQVLVQGDVSQVSDDNGSE